MVDATQLLGNDVVEVALVLHEKLTFKTRNNCQYPLKCITERCSSHRGASKERAYFSPPNNCAQVCNAEHK